MLKIYKFGSCRVEVGHLFSNTNIKIISNYELTHTTKEVLMYLDMFDKKFKPTDIEYGTCLLHRPNLFNVNHYKKMLEEADVVLIELSSLKLIKRGDHYYQHNRTVTKEPSYNEIFTFEDQDEESFGSDIANITSRINKPIVFFGHLNLDFTTVESIKGKIETRELLDKYIKKYCKNYLLPSEIFSNININDIFMDETRRNETRKDVNHLNPNGLQMIANSIQSYMEKNFISN